MNANNSREGFQSRKKQEQEIETLLDTLKTDDSEVLEGTFIALVGKGESVLLPLVELLQNSPSNQVRRNAAIALGRLGNKKAFESLQTAVRVNKTYVRIGIIIALGWLGDERGISILLKAITDTNTSVSSQVASALSKLGNTQAVEPLIKLLQHKKDYVRFNAISALGNLKDTKAVEPIIKVLELDSSGWVRSEGAASALGILSDKRAIKPLIKALKDEDNNVRFYSALALGWLNAIEALPDLHWIHDNDIGEIHGGYNTVKDAAASAIEKIKQRQQS